MRESEIEKYFNTVVTQNGAQQRKFKSPGHRGVVDRLVFAPGGRIAMVELKKPKAKPDKHQAREHALMRSLGFDVFVLDSLWAVDNFERDWL